MGSFVFKSGTEKIKSNAKSFYELSAKNIDGEIVNMS
jgi:hypothetical protein